MKKLMILVLSMITLITTAQVEIGNYTWQDVDNTLNADMVYNGTGFYSSESVSKACPEGWHISTYDEWYDLMRQNGTFSNDVFVGLTTGKFGCQLNGFTRYINNIDQVRYAGSKAKYWVNKDGQLLVVYISANSFLLGSDPLPGEKYAIRCVKNTNVNKESTIEEPDNIKIGDNLYWMTNDLVDETDGDIYFNVGQMTNNPCPVGWTVPTKDNYYQLLDKVGVEFEVQDGYEITSQIVLDIDYLMDSIGLDYTGYIEATDKSYVAFNGIYSAHWISTFDYKKNYSYRMFKYKATNKAPFSLYYLQENAFNEYAIRCVKDLEPVEKKDILLVEGWNYVTAPTSGMNVNDLFGEDISKVIIVKSDDASTFVIYVGDMVIDGIYYNELYVPSNWVFEQGRKYMIRVNTNVRVSFD